MKYTVKIQEVKDDILEETKRELVVTRGRKSFIGALFFEKESWDIMGRVIEKKEIEGGALDVVLACYEMRKRHGMTTKDNHSFLSMAHWQYVNGLTDELLTFYNCKDDSEALAKIGTAGA